MLRSKKLFVTTGLFLRTVTKKVSSTLLDFSIGLPSVIAMYLPCTKFPCVVSMDDVKLISLLVVCHKTGIYIGLLGHKHQLKTNILLV